jgi:hypothetical protein
MMAGWVEKATRFTNPEASVEITSLVASPKPRTTSLVFVISEGEAMLAVRTLVPTVPTSFRELKVARPAVALSCLVPVRVASATAIEIV